MRILPLLFLLGLIGNPRAFAALGDSEIRMFHYNVENLFDARHDEGKDDWEFLPKGYPGREKACQEKQNPDLIKICLEKDWTEEKLQGKLNQIEKVIRASGSATPDMISLVEVENEAVVARLASQLGYSHYLVTNSPDRRGIDVALIYKDSPKWKLLSSEMLRLPDAILKNPTRDILKATFAVGSRKLIVYVNHWPSQAAPASVRFQVAEHLMKFVDQDIKDGAFVFVTGDFNVIPEDRPDGLADQLMGAQRPVPLVDVQKYQKDQQLMLGLDLSKAPLGTYFYAKTMSWNLLDRFFVSPDLFSSAVLQVDPASYQVLNFPFLTTSAEISEGAHAGSVIRGVPKSYDFMASSLDGAGFSDHFPIQVNLKLK